MPDPTTEPDYATEEARLAQGGMGYLQFHVAVNWIRTWLKFNDAKFVERSDMGWSGYATWEVISKDQGSVLVSFDPGSFGHLIYSVDEGETWYGMDVTYHPPTDDREGASRWHTLWLRMREGFTSFGPAFKRDIRGKLTRIKKGRG